MFILPTSCSLSWFLNLTVYTQLTMLLFKLYKWWGMTLGQFPLHSIGQTKQLEVKSFNLA